MRLTEAEPGCQQPNRPSEICATAAVHIQLEMRCFRPDLQVLCKDTTVIAAVQHHEQSSWYGAALRALLTVGLTD